MKIASLHELGITRESRKGLFSSSVKGRTPQVIDMCGSDLMQRKDRKSSNLHLYEFTGKGKHSFPLTDLALPVGSINSWKSPLCLVVRLESFMKKL